ncbi:MAG: hypothetical protein ACLFVJ_08410 [Persicimonas sp.]
MLSKILFCTVGGSHQPIVDAVKHHQPDHVVFVCSADDAMSGRKGTYQLIEGDGMVCRSEFGEPPDLPNIPTQIGLSDDSFEVVQVPADDPEAIIEVLWTRMAQAEDQARTLIADYTGGTKSMSGGLLLSAIQSDGVELSVVTGPRSDHNRVVSGMQSAQKRSVERVRNRWRLDEARQAWKRRAYSEAAHLLERTGSSDSNIQLARVLSAGFAAWDRFEHVEAYSILSSVARHVPGQIMGAMGVLKKPTPDRHMRSYGIWNLYLMSERRADAGLYGVGVLLLYRAFEWIGQWTLEYDHDIDTGDVPAEIAEQFPNCVNEGWDGKLTMAMHSAWQVIAELGGPMADVGRATEKNRTTVARLRNKSLFAHGFEPLDEADYLQVRAFFDEEVKPAFVKAAFGKNPPYGQLPDELTVDMGSLGAGG